MIINFFLRCMPKITEDLGSSQFMETSNSELRKDLSHYITGYSEIPAV